VQKPTVLHGSHNYHIAGGSDRYFFELSQLLAAKGHKVVPFCGASTNNEASEYSRYFPTTPDAGNPSPADAVRFIYSHGARNKIEQAIAEQRPDIAHLHIYYGKLTGSILGPLRKAGIPVVQTLHEYKLLCPVYTCIRNEAICEDCQGRYFWKALANRCNRGSILRSAASTLESYVSKALGAVSHIDHFIGASQFMTDKMLSIGIPDHKISTVHNFVDSARFTPASSAGSYVLYFGRLEKTKGLFTLIDALRSLPKMRCVIAGDGPARAELQARAESYGLRHIDFLGFVSGSKLHDLIRGASCTVLPSEWYENCPMSVLESLAFARPVIGTSIGGIPELIDDGQDGRLVAVAQPQQLSEALAEIAGNPARAMEMGMVGLDKVRNTFSPALHYAQIDAIYRKLLN
jgi:glycosyltransferase involved in cell wall biosynthesis